MKLRLFENTVRVRLTQNEVHDLAAGKPLRSATRFLNGGELQLEISTAQDPGISASFADSRVQIVLYCDAVTAWARSNEEGLYAATENAKLAIEKDYACLHQDGSPENLGTYPNPAAPADVKMD